MNCDINDKDEEPSAEAVYRNMCSIDMLGVDGDEGAEHLNIIYEDGDDPNYQGDLEASYEIPREEPVDSSSDSESDVDVDVAESHVDSESGKGLNNGPSLEPGHSPVNEPESDDDQDVDMSSPKQNGIVSPVFSSPVRVNKPVYSSSEPDVDIDNSDEHHSSPTVQSKPDTQPSTNGLAETRMVKPLTLKLKPVTSKPKIYSSSEEESDGDDDSTALVINEEKIINGDTENLPLTIKTDKKNLLPDTAKNPLALLSEGEHTESDGYSTSDESSNDDTQTGDHSRPPSNCRECGEPFDASSPQVHRCSSFESTSELFWVCSLCEDRFSTEDGVRAHISSDEHLRCVFCKKKISVRPVAAHKHVKECPNFPNKTGTGATPKKVKTVKPKVAGKVTEVATPTAPGAAQLTPSGRAMKGKVRPFVSELPKSGQKRWNKLRQTWVENTCVACGMTGFASYVARFLHFKEYHHKNVCLDCGAIYDTPQPLMIHMKKVHCKVEHEHSDFDPSKKYDTDSLILCIDCNATLRFSELEKHYCKPAYGRKQAKPQQAPMEAVPALEEPPPVPKVAAPVVSDRPVRARRQRRRSSASDLSVNSDDIPFDDSEPETKTPRIKGKSGSSRRKSPVRKMKSPSPVPSAPVSPATSPPRAPSLSPDSPLKPESESSEDEPEIPEETPRIPTPEPPPREPTPEPLSPIPHIPVDWKEQLEPLLYKLVLRLRKTLSKVQDTKCRKCLSFESTPSSIQTIFNHLKDSHDLFLLRGLGADTEHRLFSEVTRIYMSDISQGETEELGEQKMVKPFCMNTGKLYFCSLCNSGEMKVFDFVNHLRVAHSFKYYPCIECGRRFRNYGLLLSHLSGDGPLLFGCRICNVSGIQNVHTLESHIRTHAVCERCFSGSDGQLALKNHLYSHQKERPFGCTICVKSYKTHESLEMHLLWKHGTEGNQCLKCSQKVWQCTYHFCPGTPGEEYQEELLNRCTVCRLDFKTAEMLRIHNRLHSGTRPHKCDKCDRAFISKKLLQKHKERSHARENKVLDKSGELPKKKAAEILRKIGGANRKELQPEVTEDIAQSEKELLTPDAAKSGMSIFDIDESEKQVEEEPVEKEATPEPKVAPKPKEPVIPYFLIEHDYCKPGPLPEVRMAKPRKRTNSLRIKLPKVQLSSSSSGSDSSSSSSSSDSDSESTDSDSPANVKKPSPKKEKIQVEKTPEPRDDDGEKEVNIEDSECDSESETDSIATEPDDSIHESDLESEGSETERRFRSPVKSPVKEYLPSHPPPKSAKIRKSREELPVAPPRKPGGLKVLLPKHLQRPNGGLKTLMPSAPKPSKASKPRAPFKKTKGLKVLQPKNQASSDEMNSDTDSDYASKNSRKRKASKMLSSSPKKSKLEPPPVSHYTPSAPPPAIPGQETGKLYCYCRCPYDEVSQMIGCDASDCPYEWFHFECVGIMIPPEGRWFCPDCRLRPKYQGKST